MTNQFTRSDKAYQVFEEEQISRGIDIDQAVEQIKALQIETPSWGYGDSGTRFKVFQQEGVPRSPFEKIDDAAFVHELTGACSSVAIHIPWDHVDNFAELKDHAQAKGIGLGAVNPNLFQEDIYKFGSVTNTDPDVRKRAVDHLLECADIAKTIGSRDVSLWFADGSNYPGQVDFRQRKHWMYEGLKALYEALDENQRMLIEYKFFEPAFYHTDLADWGMAFNMANKLGGKAQVLVDTGHHAQGTNIEHIVAYLIDEEKLGGFHFNSRKYADDDLIAASLDPYELFLIFNQIQLASADTNPDVQKTAKDIAFMLDQSHNVEKKIPAVLRSIMNVQTQFAKSLLVNHQALAEKQVQQDVLGAEQVVREAYEFDVRPLLHRVREELGRPIDPYKAYEQSGYEANISSRGKGGMSW
ncbi:L-rhamnose isomerase [Aureibacillus halotolerans]|uniref:L-rhamnose isomerase/sugar isomerase n=1 Tax=Aureibacillus halotolerans TaxID=1508390 RepID=A0A4R6U5G4_9BACI|nr:L-rhamnose isomerase [Aureibacillus halotolerans]TDQ38274.1 L-rhamnose isomerase/sugar isomerase [Aureibacillus halotolerans]